MSPSPNFSPEKKPDYLQLLRFCRTDGIVNGPEDSHKLDSIKIALNNSLSTPLPIRPLLPLIYRNATKIGIFDQLKPDIQNFIKSNAMLLVGEELAKEQWLRGTIRMLEESNIPIILLKGAAFSGYIYSPDAPRPGVDIDFLVKWDDFDRTCKVLGETMNPVILAKNRLVTHRTLFERIFIPKARSNPTVEVHRGLTNPHIFNIDEERLWCASEMHPRYKNKNVRMLSLEDTLLHLAVHAFRDMDFCNHNLLDAHQLICQRGIKEETLYRNGSNWGAKAILYYLLFNAQQVMGTPTQQGLLDSLEPTGIVKRVHRYLLRSSVTPTEEKPTNHRVAQIASQLFLPDKLPSALKFQAHYAKIRLADFISP